MEQGLLQRQGDLTVIEGRFSSSKRRVFLFENMIIIAKKNKVSKGSTETFTCKESYKVQLCCHGNISMIEILVIRDRGNY